MKNAVKKIFACIAFLSIFFAIAFKIGIYFKPTDNAEARSTIANFYNEEKNSIDVVAIGASSIYRYWNAPYIYDNYEVTSYCLGTPIQLAEAAPYLMKEASKTQDVKLFVVEVRRLFRDQIMAIDEENRLGEKGLYYFSVVTDSMQYSLNRTLLIDEVIEEKGDKLIWNIDLLKYHDNWKKISNESIEQTEEIYNSASELKSALPAKAGKLIADGQYPDYELISGYELDEKHKKLIDDIQNTAKKLGARVMFVYTPHYSNDKYYSISQSMKKYCYVKGYDYLDANSLTAFEQMNLSFAGDFYNKYHVNINGSEKFSDYVMQYIMERYGLVKTPLTGVAAMSWQRACIKYFEISVQYKEDIEQRRRELGALF